AYGAEPGSKRDDPVPMGTEARVGDYAVTVLEVTPNADAMVAEANQFNDPPAEGRQYVIARVSITYVGADSGTPWVNLSFRAVGNRNVGYSIGGDGCGVVPDGLSDTPELFEGGQIETNVCWSIETVDVDSLVMYAEQYFADGGRVWFSLDATAKPPMSGQKHQASATATPDSKASAGTVVEVETVDVAFQPRDLHIPADTDVTIVVTNKGVLQHDFVIEAEGISSGVLDSGDSTKIVVNLPAGTYQFWCTLPGHKESGMVGTLIVE
ncbi:MAG: cupredoxin domain-containing protein, partial [Mycolicibacterium fortuitum]